METTHALSMDEERFYEIIDSLEKCGRKSVGIVELAILMNRPVEDIEELEAMRYASNSRIYRAFHNFKERINNFLGKDKIIIVDKNYEYRFATKNEADRYFDKLRNRGLDYLARASFVAKKIGLDKQEMILDQHLNEVDGEFHEEFRR